MCDYKYLTKKYLWQNYDSLVQTNIGFHVYKYMTHEYIPSYSLWNLINPGTNGNPLRCDKLGRVMATSILVLNHQATSVVNRDSILIFPDKVTKIGWVYDIHILWTKHAFLRNHYLDV